MLLLLVGQPYVVSGALEAAGTIEFIAAAELEYVPLELSADASIAFTATSDATVAVPVDLAADVTLTFTATADAAPPFSIRGNPEWARPGSTRGEPGSVTGGTRSVIASAGAGAGRT